MANVSTARKLGIAARIAGRQVKGTRTYGAVVQGARTALGHFGAALHQLWLEVTGFVFLVFAMMGGVAMSREYAAYRAGTGSKGHFAAATGFTLIFAWFGVSSFWKARRRARKTR